MKKVFLFLRSLHPNRSSFLIGIIIYFLFFTEVLSQVPYYYYPVPSGTTNNLYEIKSKNNSYVHSYICGANGTFIIQPFADSSWIPIISNTSADLNGITSQSSYPFYIVGNNGIFIKSTNYGTNWLQYNIGVSENLYSCVFFGIDIYSRRSMVVGANGLIMKNYLYLLNDTIWTIVQSGTNYDLKSICFNNRFSWVAGKNGTILNSYDTGNIWHQQFSSVVNDLNSVNFADSATGFTVGNGGMILKTSNGGLNWTQKASNTNQNLNFIYTPSLNDIWIAGDKIILHSSNAGENFNIESGAPQYNLHSCAYVYSKYYENNLPYFVGENGKIFRKTPDTLFRPGIFAQLDANNINSCFWKRGIFDQNYLITNTAGFEWPKGTGKTAIFSAGLCIGAFVNGQLRQASASYYGEYTPGYCSGGNFYTNDYFKIYKVNKTDNAQTSWDWANWGQMVPFGAPFIDVNHNGIYEPAIDTPGVSNAKETIFLCMTDANQSSHTSGEGFGGGTLPLGAEVHMTAWAYDTPGLQDVQFINYDIINKSPNIWTATQIGNYFDADLGDANDDYLGCDTVLDMAYFYNADNNDAMYGINPPAVGISLLRSPLNRNVTPNIRLAMTSFTSIRNTSSSPAVCESDPDGEAYPAYLMLSGFKKDSTCFLDPTQVPPKKTKYCFPGDPETNIGWTEIKGAIWNCNHDSTGTVHVPNSMGERHSVFGSGATNFNIVPGESQKFVIAQLIARDSGNLKSVTKLKQLCAYVRNFYENNFPININQISTNIPQNFELKQNYPNPFNPSTIIKFQIKDSRFVTLKVYDILGREVATLINENLKTGTYETQFPNNQYTINQMASGVYFYKLVAGDFVAVKRMILLK